jgi:hypothetical protein
MTLMQTGFPAKKQIEQELAILNTPTYQDARDTFISYVRLLQNARTAGDLRILQRELILDVNARQKALAEVIAERRPPVDAEIERLKAMKPPPKNELAAAQRVLHGVKHAKAVAMALQHATRTLADGMVWRAFDYDRPTISVLGKEQPVARHADDAGFTTEICALEFMENEHGLLTFHNDTTNILRRGDITSVVPLDDRRAPWPREVKAGKASGAKQIARIRKALEMIESRRLLVPVPFVTELPVLAELIEQAKKDGYAKKKLDCRFIEVIDLSHWGRREQKLEEVAQKALKELGWSDANRVILVGTSSVNRIRDRGDPVVELAPISIFPLPPEVVTDLLLGFIDVRVRLNTQLLAMRFAERGMRVTFMTAPSSHVHFLEARRGYRGIKVPAYVREQMLHELITVGAFIDLVDWILASGRTRDWSDPAETPILGFEDEGSAWSAGNRIELENLSQQAQVFE